MAVTARKLQEKKEQRNDDHRDASTRRRTGSSQSKTNLRKTKKAARRARLVALVQLISAGLVLFSIALGMVYIESMVAARGYELAQLRSELEQQQAVTGQMETEVASMRSSGRIAQIATEDLDMIPASNDIGSSDSLAFAAGFNSDDFSGSNETEEKLYDASKAEVHSSDKEVQSSDEGKKVVVELEPSEEEMGLDIPKFSDISTWFFRWLRGNQPARADMNR